MRPTPRLVRSRALQLPRAGARRNPAVERRGSWCETAARARPCLSGTGRGVAAGEVGSGVREDPVGSPLVAPVQAGMQVAVHGRQRKEADKPTQEAGSRPPRRRPARVTPVGRGCWPGSKGREGPPTRGDGDEGSCVVLKAGCLRRGQGGPVPPPQSLCAGHGPGAGAALFHVKHSTSVGSGGWSGLGIAKVNRGINVQAGWRHAQSAPSGRSGRQIGRFT